MPRCVRRDTASVASLPMNDNHPRDPHIDRPFATLVAIAMACFVIMIFVLFPRHDVSMGPGQPTTPARGGGGPPAQTIETPSTPKQP